MSLVSSLPHLMPYPGGQLGLEATAFLLLSQNAWLRAKLAGSQWCCKALQQEQWWLWVLSNQCTPTCLPSWGWGAAELFRQGQKPKSFPALSSPVAADTQCSSGESKFTKEKPSGWHQQSKAALTLGQQTLSCLWNRLHFLISTASSV